MNCPHCKQSDKIFNAGDGMLGCMCGERFNPKAVVKPYKVRNSHDRKTKNKLPRACSNCGRKKKIKCKDLCMGCYDSAIHAGPAGSSQFKAGLKRAKQRFNDPFYSGKRGTYPRDRKGMAA